MALTGAGVPALPGTPALSGNASTEQRVVVLKICSMKSKGLESHWHVKSSKGLLQGTDF